MQLLLCSFVIWITPATAKTFEPKITHDPQKDWTIAFNSEILFNENIKNYIYIETESGDQHPVSLDISEDSKKVMVHAKNTLFNGRILFFNHYKRCSIINKKPLKEETSMSFKVQGKHIQSIQATLNPLVTNIVVQGTKEVSTMSISINGTNETPLHQGKNNQFSRGLPGLINGDEIHVRAYTGKGDLLEEQTYRISN